MKARRMVVKTVGGSLVVGLGLMGCAQTRRELPFETIKYEPLVSVMDSRQTKLAEDQAHGAVVPAAGIRKPREILALSSGGCYGAFTAGVLSGWTSTGERPEFDVVTGVSTGALIAPFAFLGPEFDAHANRLYVDVKAEDVYRFRSWVTLPFRDSLATSKPLKNLIESHISGTVLTRLAEEHRKGRRLYVGTTNLDTRRLVIWDLGAIACQPDGQGRELIRDILLASASVPGMFPPVTITVNVDGKSYQELHGDGGATATVFVPEQVFETAKADGVLEEPSGRLTVIIAGKLYPDVSAVRQRMLPVLASTAQAILHANTRIELAYLARRAHDAGLRFYPIALRQDFQGVEDALNFDSQMQTVLLAEGMRVGSELAKRPSPAPIPEGDRSEIRTGVRLRRADAVRPLSPNPSPSVIPAGGP